jgi:exodeoxyribonuclease VII small subunit
MPDESEPELSFEQALGQLERIVASLERGEPELTSALAKYETGVRLLKTCYGLLDQAEQSVALLTGVDPAGNPLSAPFDASATIITREVVSAVTLSPEVESNPPKKRKPTATPPSPKKEPPAPTDPSGGVDPPF